MQNQAPEIQAKLLAMQKHMVQHKDMKTIFPPASVPTQQALQVETSARLVAASSEAVEKAGKQKPPMSSEQKEEHARWLWIDVTFYCSGIEFQNCDSR